MGFVYALIAAGLSLIFGLMEIVNFAHGEFLMFAMFRHVLGLGAGGLDPLVALNQLAHTLSGGEQQMVAIARGLMSRPRFLMVDEPTLGLAPRVVTEILEVLRRLNREQGITILFEETGHQALGDDLDGHVSGVGGAVTPLRRVGGIVASAFGAGQPGAAAGAPEPHAPRSSRCGRARGRGLFPLTGRGRYTTKEAFL